MGNVIGKSSKVTRLKEDSEESRRAKALQEKKSWLDSTTFSDLPPEGREAFIEFAREKQFNTDARRLEFWFGSPEEAALTPFLSKYLSDGEDQLPEVQESDDTDDVIESAKHIDSYVSKVKDRMRPRLNDLFRKFKDFLVEEITKQQT